MRAEQITGPDAHHGEGPIWDNSLGLLMWVDLLRGDVLSCVPGGMVERRHIATLAACVVPRREGGWAVATERGFALVDPDGKIEALPDVWDEPSIRMNDGACDAQGRFYCGSMGYSAELGRGSLFRLDPDRSVHTIYESVTISNGIGWSPDGSKAYYIDSPTQRVDVCSPDLISRESFIEIPPDAGVPDGLTVDADGGIWVALWRGASVRRYTPDGELDDVVALPVRQPTSCAFGGKGLDTLFISTSALDLQEPELAAGAIFAVQPGVKGLPTSPYGG